MLMKNVKAKARLVIVFMIAASTFSGTVALAPPASATALSDNSVVTDPISGRSYYVQSGTTSLSFSDQYNQAKTFTYNGAEGHLVAPVNSEENAFVTNLLGIRQTWMALQDVGPSGGSSRNWTWTAGSLSGSIVTRCTAASSGNCTSTDYANWDLKQGEPNNSGNVEFAALLNYGAYFPGAGYWNDCGNTCGPVAFAVEFDSVTPTASLSPSASPSASPRVPSVNLWKPMVALGDAHSCVMLTSENIRCWGNAWGPSVKDVPTDLGNVQSISAGGAHTCVVTTTKQGRCWGDVYGGVAPASTVPSDLGQVRFIASGGTHNCAILLNQTLRCWGSNNFGEINVPSSVVTVKAVATSGGRHDWGSETTCAIDQDSKVQCWGNNSYGQTNVPVDLGSVIQIAEGWFNSCAITSSNDLRCWGAGTVPFGQIPQVPNGLGKVLKVAVGAYMACAINLNHLVECWGAGYTGSQVQPPEELGQVTDIALGWEHACAIKISGAIVCWGSGGDAADGRALLPSDLPLAQISYQTTASAPANLSASAGNHQVTVAFMAPIDNGGVDITNYEYSTDNGSTWFTAYPAQTTSPIVITGLINGAAHSIKVRAVNSVGSGQASDSISVIPKGLISASEPRIWGAKAGSKSVTLGIWAPIRNGGTAIVRYEYTLDDGATWSPVEVNSNPLRPVITGLVNGINYTLKLRAINGAGAGAESRPISFTPVAVSTAPQNVTVKAIGSGAIKVQFSAPNTDGGTPIIRYGYSINGGPWKSIRSSRIIYGLENGATYSVRIAAQNAEGLGTPSEYVFVTPGR